MRILFLTNFYPPNDLGGCEQLCREIVELMAARGHEIRVLTSTYGVKGQTPAESGVTRALHLEAPVDYYRPTDFFFRRQRLERENRETLRETIESFRPDLVFVWGLLNLSLALPYWAEQWVGPQHVAYAVANYWPIEPDIHEAYWRLPARRTVTELAKSLVRSLALRELARERQKTRPQLVNVFCVSEYVRTKLQSCGALPHGACVIYNGIDPDPFLTTLRSRCATRDIKLLYFGGLSHIKGVHTAIEALGALRQRGQAQGLSLGIVGDGHPVYVEHLKALVHQFALQDQVAFLGRVPRAAIPYILSQYEAFLFTSIYEEPIARTVMEAMMAGLAVIGTAVGGQSEMLEDGVNALVFPSGDASALADQIVRLRESPELYDRLIGAGRRTVLERFTLRRMIDEIEEWLEEILAEACS